MVTEKLDGGNTLLHAGEVFARSVTAPSGGKWMAMVKKHHAWKVNEPDVYLYGEDIYGVHSITYEPVAEHETFHAFALRHGDGTFAAFEEVETYANSLAIPVVPVLFKGCFGSVAGIRAFVKHAHSEASVPGGEREGVVLAVGARVPGGAIPRKRVQERSRRPCADQRALDPELEALPYCAAYGTRQFIYHLRQRYRSAEGKATKAAFAAGARRGKPSPGRFIKKRYVAPRVNSHVIHGPMRRASRTCVSRNCPRSIPTELLPIPDPIEIWSRIL